jgi:hypothetical protein
MPQIDTVGSIVREPIKAISDPTLINITAPNTETAVVTAVDASRKGTVVHNTGVSRLKISYGLITTDVLGVVSQKVAYIVHLAPDNSYLSDFPELVPVSASTTDASGSLTLVELR